MIEPAPDKRREEARQALEGEGWQKKRLEKRQRLESRREEAKRAMEGEAQKAQRLTEARAKTRQEASAQQVKAKEHAQELAEQLKITQAKEAGERAVATEAARRQKISETENNIEQAKREPTQLTALRTLKTDLVRAASRGASITGAIIDRQQTLIIGGQAGSSAKSGKNHSLFWLTLILILVAAGGGVYVYFFYHQAPAGPAPDPIESRPSTFQNSFLLNNGVVDLVVDNFNRDDFLINLRRLINDETKSPGQIKLFSLITAGRELTLGALLEKLALDPPEILRADLKNSFILARHERPGRNEIFLIFQTNNPESALNGLREWESDLPNLFYLLTGHPNFIVETSTTTTGFASQLNNNLEARVWNNPLSDRDPDLLYVFLESNTIAIIESEATLIEILNRRNNL